MTPSLDELENEAALGGRPRRPAHGQSPRRPTPDSRGPQAPRRGQGQARRAPRPARPRYTFLDFLRDERTHLGAGIFLCLIALVMAGCTISFLFNSAADQSLVHGHSIQEIVDTGRPVNNAFGAFGAKMGEWLLVDTLGIGAFVMVVYIFVIGLAVMGLSRVSFFRFTFRCLFTTVALSVIFGLFSYNRADMFHLGGNHGYYINELVIKYSDVLGAYALTVLLIGFLVAVYLAPLKQLASVIGRNMPKRKQKIEQPETTETATLDTLGEPDINAGSDAEADEVLDEVQKAESVKTDHSRFMPPAALDDFEEDVAEDPVVAAVPSVSENEEDIPEVKIGNTGEDVSVEMADDVEEKPRTVVDGPEIIVVSDSLDTASDASAEEPIRHGDHIGLDRPYDVNAEHPDYEFPPMDLLVDRPKTYTVDEEEQAASRELIVNALRSYQVEIEKIKSTIGPTVTLYEIVPAQGTRISKIRNLEDDIAMNLSALGIRIIAPIPGKGTIGIEVPNSKPQIVSMRTILESDTFRNTHMRLPMALGATIANKIFMIDLAKTPHLLVAGATGQGKSVGLNCIITSLLYSKRPDELKFILVDPKMVEFSLYAAIDRQYMAKIPDEESAVITDPSKVTDTLNSLCVEMDNRYELLKAAGVREIEMYNERFRSRMLSPDAGHRFLPYIVVIVDEYADLVMTADKDISVAICRIAQKARAVGIHMIIATQRPSTDIITGKIKANFPARISFKTTQSVDSRTILDRPGSQQLIGRGDMLVMYNGVIERVQCALVDTPEVEAICKYIGEQPGFTGCYLLPDPPAEEGGEVPAADIHVTDEFRRCALYVASQSQASITMIQRKFEIGFNKAGRFMDQMQQLGIVGPANGQKPRQVQMTPDEVEQLLNNR